MRLSAGLDILERRKYFLTFAGNEPDSVVVKSVA